MYHAKATVNKMTATNPLAKIIFKPLLCVNDKLENTECKQQSFEILDSQAAQAW